jgi:hypothetical protein
LKIFWSPWSVGYRMADVVTGIKGAKQLDALLVGLGVVAVS